MLHMQPASDTNKEKHGFLTEAYFRHATLAKIVLFVKTILINMQNSLFILGSSSVMQRVNVNCRHV